MTLAVVALAFVALSGWVTALLMARELSHLEAQLRGQRPRSVVQLHGGPCDGQRVEIRDDDQFAIVASAPDSTLRLVTMADHIVNTMEGGRQMSVYRRVQPAPFAYVPSRHTAPTRSKP